MESSKYKDVSVLFPEWPEARISLRNLVRNGVEWVVSSISDDVLIGLSFPIRVVVSGKEMPLLRTFRRDRIIKIDNICDTIISERMRHLDVVDYWGMAPDDLIFKRVKSDLEHVDDKLESVGGRSLLEEVMFRIGIRYDYFQVKWCLK